MKVSRVRQCRLRRDLEAWRAQQRERPAPDVLKGVWNDEDLWVLRQQRPGTEGGPPLRRVHGQPLDAFEPLSVLVHQGHDGNRHVEDLTELQPRNAGSGLK